ncbi:MAG: hypothetical protein D6B27_01825 [Gammaproteobacteria bacterium]|nr:MAG: hypothetical protein D6B27_01825 [Gammaproteobacteria bacterium]
MAEKKRDLSLDLIKGIGCIMVPVAHIFSSKQPSVAEVWVDGFAEMGAILFLSVVGVTSMLQIRNGYSLRGTVLFYIFLGIIGVSFNCLLPQYFIDCWAFEIFQIIAFGAIFTAVIEYYLKPKPIFYLLIAVSIVAMKFILDFAFEQGLIEKTSLPNFIFPPDNIYLDSGEIDYPGFALIPWLFIFPLGVFAYQARSIVNLIMGTFSFSLLAALYYFGYQPEIFKKWDMTIGYLLFSVTVMFYIFYITRLLNSYVLKGENILTRLGKDSLLLMYVHLPAILLTMLIGVILNALKLQEIISLPVSIIVLLLITYLFIVIARMIPELSLLASVKNWVALAFITVFLPIIFLVPYLLIDIKLIYIGSIVLLWIIEFTIGVIFALNYKQLANLLRN